MASAPIYCTHKELKRVFPQLDEFDQKVQIFGFGSNELTNVFDTSQDIGYCYNTGLVSQLFIDGIKINKLTFNTTETTKLDGAVSKGASTLTMDAGHGLAVKDIIKINNEYMKVGSVSTNDIGVTPENDRGLFDTASVAHANDSSVFKIMSEGDAGDSTSAGQDALAFTYDPDLDLVLIVKDGMTLIDHSVEAGEDFTTMVTQFRTDASRYLDSRLDPKLPKNQWKDKNGNFDYMIIRTTALYAAAFMVKTKDPTSELATALMTEADNNVQLLNEGRAALSWQNTGDASKGVLRDVSYTDGSVRPVDFRGRAGGVDYDLIKVSISGSTAGVIGTAKYNVYVKDSTGLKTNQVVTEEVITGDYQALAYGLQVRFAGTANDSVATATNEWEVEVRGYNEEVDTGDLKGIKMTRRRHYL
tara:strand:- start:2045 stop:3292 length:1248 start_codon:yes stop_codon:yes gene_type:complete